MVGKMAFREIILETQTGASCDGSEYRLTHGLAPEAIEEFLAELAALFEPVEVHFSGSRLSCQGLVARLDRLPMYRWPKLS